MLQQGGNMRNVYENNNKKRMIDRRSKWRQNMPYDEIQQNVSINNMIYQKVF